jgi:hypothetical protein
MLPRLGLPAGDSIAGSQSQSQTGEKFSAQGGVQKWEQGNLGLADEQHAVFLAARPGAKSVNLVQAPFLFRKARGAAASAEMDDEMDRDGRDGG